MNDVAKDELKVVVDRAFPLSDAAVAHAYIESSGGCRKSIALERGVLSGRACRVIGRALHSAM